MPSSRLIVALAMSAAAALLLAAPRAANAQVSFGGSTYFLTTTVGDWAAAEAEAVSLGGHLAAIGSAAENSFLTTNFTIPQGRLFIGLNDIAVENTFVWPTGEPVVFTNWNGGEPNNAGNEDAVELQSSGGWNDVPVNFGVRGIIEVTNTAAPEPATGLLALCGVAVAGALRRRRRA